MSSSAKATVLLKYLTMQLRLFQERSKLGATQNRLEHTINNLKNIF